MHRQTIKSFEKLKNDRLDQIYWIHIREKYDVAAGAVIRYMLCVLGLEISGLGLGQLAKYQVLCGMIFECKHAGEKRQEKVFRCPIWL